MTAYIRVSNFSGGRSGGPRPTGFFATLARFGLLIVGAVVGLFVFVLTASAALVILATLAIAGFAVFMWFWVRAKFFGKPFGGQAFADMRAAAQAQQQTNADIVSAMNSATGAADDKGEVIDAHRTAQGWTVDE